jgi:hypothetical protein
METTIPIDPEQAAFGSLLTLEANDPELDRPLPDGTIPRDRVRATLQDYVTRQQSNGLPLFPNVTAQANKKRTDYLTGLYTKPLEDLLDGPTLANLEKKAAYHPNPDAFRQREINRTYLSALVGRPLSGPGYEATRAAFATQHLGLTPNVDDTTFHQAVKTRILEDQAATTTTDTLRNQVFQSVLAGSAAPEIDLTTIPERHRDAAVAAISDARLEARRMRRAVLPNVDRAIPLLTRAAELEKDLKAGSQMVANELILSAFRDSYPENKADRPLYFVLLAQKLQALPQDQRGAVTRAFQSVGRTLNTIGENVGDIARAVETQTTGRAGFTEADEDLSKDFRQFQRLFQTEGAGLQKATDTFFQRGAIGVGASLPYTFAALAGPYGMLLNAGSFAGESYTEQRIANPEGDRTIQLPGSLVTGTIESAIETTFTKFGVKAMQGKLPTVFNLLNRAKLTGLPRAAAGGLAAATITGATEYTEEFLQAGTREFTQAVARDLSNLGSPYDWQGFFDDWGAAQRDIIPTVTIFALVAGGGASFSHFRQGEAMRKNRTVLYGLGVPESKIESIANAATPAEADVLTQAAAKEGLENRTAEERQTVLDVMRKLQQLSETAGLPVVSPSTNTFTGEQEWTFTDPISKEQRTFETEEESLLYWREYQQAQREETLDRFESLSETTFLDFIQSEGTASADTDVEISTKPLRISDIRAELTKREQTTLAALDKETNPVRRADLNTTLQDIADSRARIDARIEAAVLMHGPASAVDFQNALITGRRFTEQTRTGLTRHVVQLFRGRSIQDVMEEFSEDFLARGIADGIIRPESIVRDIQAFQAASGSTLLPPNYTYTPENSLPLLEAFSAISRAAAMSQVRTGLLPPEVSQWIEIQIATMDSTIGEANKLAADLRRTADWKAALDNGNLTPELESLIQDSLGLNQEARAQRFEIQARAQLAAEAMEGFPEIADSISGRLPHPETLRKENHPLLGEVRTLWQSLLKPTRRRSKTGRTVDRTNEANAFFLPIGQMVDLDDVRRSLNERGFAFETPADMLDAAIDSLAYGKPQYGTSSLTDESFAIALPPTTQESREVSPTAQIEASRRGNFSSPVDPTVSDVASMRPRRDGRTNESFSISRQQEIYGDAHFSLQMVRNDLRDIERKTENERQEWEKQHGSLVNLPPASEIFSASLYYDTGYSGSETRKQGPVLQPDGSKRFGFTESAEEFVARVQSTLNHPAFTGTRVSWFANIPGQTTSIGANGFTGAVEATAPGYDYAPFPESPELIAAREAVAAAEAELYLAEQDFDPANATAPDDPSADPSPVAASTIRQRELSKHAAAYAALLDARDQEARNAAQSFIARVWNAYAQHDEIFQYGKTTSRSAEDIAAAVSTSQMTITADDAGSTVTFRHGSGSLTIESADTPRPYIRAASAASKGKKSGGGARLYQAALDWIHNNGKRIKDDPGGLSAINQIRRTSNFFASAIRWGTTAHLKPHAEQRVGKWTKNDVLNTSLLATKEMENTFSAIPSAKGWTFDFQTGTFADADGNTLTEDFLENTVANAVPGTSGIGLSTLQRSLITSSAIQAFQRGTAESVIQTAESSLPSSLTGVSYSLSLNSLQRIETAIARRMNAGPEERADFFERLRNRLAAIVQRIEDTNAGLGPFGRTATADPVIDERRRIADAIAEARTIIDTLPPEARGRVGIDYNDLVSQTTERGRVNALLRLIDRADEALEALLITQYTEALEKLSDLAKPNLQPNKQIRGRLTPEIQRVVNRAIAAMGLTPQEHSVATITQQATITELEAQRDAETDPDRLPDLEAAVVDAYLTQHFLETFGNIGSMSAPQLANAYRELLTLYSTGRSQRTMIDQANRQELMQARREILDSLPDVTQPQWAKRTENQGILDNLESFRLGLSSFHQVIEWILPNSLAARDFQDAIRKADRAFTRAKIDARDRFDAAMFAAWNLTGRSKRRRMNRILAGLSKRRDDWNIGIRESNGTEEIKMSEEQAAAILDGTLKPGWETDPIAMESLRQSLTDFRAQRRKAQAEDKAFTKKVIRFQKVRSRAPQVWLHASDMEAVYWLQLWDQEQYRPTLDKHGFTAEVIDQIRAKLSPKALDVYAHLRREYNAEYDRLNPVFRRLYNLDMPRIRNYAPGSFENVAGAPSELDAHGNPTTSSINAMSTGFTKSRTHHMARPKQANALGLYWSHLEATEYFVAFGETMRDARILFRNPELRRKIEGLYGTRVAGDWSRWLDGLELDGRFKSASVSAMQAMVQSTLNTTSAVGLAYNVGTLFKQASAALGVFMELPTTAAIRGIIGVFQNPGDLRTIWQTESIQQRILSGVSPEDRRILEAAQASPSEIMELLILGRLPIAYADAAFTTAAGSIAYRWHYDEAIKAGLGDSQAHEAALAVMDRVVTRTAQPATTQDKSLAELSAVGFGKLLFLFRSDPRQKFAITLDALRRAFTGRMSKKEAANRALWSWAIYGIMSELMTDTWHAISRDDDDPERWSWQDYLAAAVAGPIAGVPIIGSGIEYIIRSQLGTKAFANSANPLDKAAASIFTQSGVNSKLYEDLAAIANEDKPLDFTDLISAAQKDSAAAAALIGAFDSRAAIVPALLRAARDLGGITSNIFELVYESDQSKIARILEEEKQNTTTTRESRTTTLDDLEAQLITLSPEAREARLAAMDGTQAATLRRRLRTRTLAPDERILDSLPAAQRQAAIARILAAIQDPARREALADRYAILFPD